MTQAQALKTMLSGANVFLTGAAGAGKTYTLNEFIEQAEKKGKNVAVTASTGIAASHIGGSTIHSWSGLGIMDSLSQEDLEWKGDDKRIKKRYKNADILIIDEVSMLHGARLDMVNRMAKYCRKNNMAFGGLQVVLVGDLFQLPPVSRDSNEFDFAHLSKAWAELDLQVCYITEQHRQEGEDLLLELLEAMRCNTVNTDHLTLLKNRVIEPNETVTRLYSHNVDVDAINQEHLDAIPTKAKTFKMRTSGNPKITEALKRNILAPELLELKVGAEVMFVANNFSDGFVNGSRGKVVKFKNGDPIVKLHTGRTIRVDYHSWKTKEGDMVIAEVEQIPLRLAWAITIHKSQGMSIDAAQIDLSKSFMPSMGYVALSRVRSMAGLYLVGINDMALTMHKDIYAFDRQLKEQSKLVTDGK